MLKYIGTLLKPEYWPALAQGIVPTLEHDKALRDFAFTTVVDVGANKGQFAYFASRRWPTAELYCFEPLPRPRARLKALLNKRATILPYALGSSRKRAPIHIASREDSSSLLPLGARQKHIFSMNETGIHPVEVVRLDDILKEKIIFPALLKIDVQGFELEVIKGASKLIKNFSAIYVEASFVELYDGQPLAEEIISLLKSQNFQLIDLYNTSFDFSGAPIQADFLFIHSEGLQK